jgi:hypothetical protein
MTRHRSRRSKVSTGLLALGAAAALAGYAAAGAPGAPGAPGALAAQAAALTAPLQQRVVASAPRPFEHRAHERVSCLACHGAAGQHRTLLVRSPRDCASCHHDPRQGLECSSCHEAAALPEQRRVAANVAATAGAAARAGTLPFGHETHRLVDCRECHQAPVTLALEAGCASCHASHHRPAADCTACHEAAAPRRTHDNNVHLGCAGAGCHDRSRVPDIMASRTLCLTCHAEQQAHMPAGSCVACHVIPGRAPRHPSGGAD